jgi:uncharacterized glyoxalase superfamily protein PhnB
MSGSPRRNRSIPDASVMPVLSYADPVAAADFLERAFGFRVRLRIGSHRIQLTFGGGAMVATEQAWAGAESASSGHSVLVRVADADRHHATAAAAGARILQPPTDRPYGERQYVAEDIGGHHWTFSESIADVDPASWGGELVNLPEDAP